MIYGTAGFTAALSIYKIINAGIKPETERYSYRSHRRCGERCRQHAFQAGLQCCDRHRQKIYRNAHTPRASEVMARDEIDGASPKPLLKTRWAAVLDTVGGTVLAAPKVLAVTDDGVVTTWR